MARFKLNGRLDHQLKISFILGRSLLYVSLRRLVRGPRLPNWGWSYEVGSAIARAQHKASFDMPDLDDARAFMSALAFRSPALKHVSIEPLTMPVKGHWYKPQSSRPERTLLYLHGGGYAFYSRAHESMIALIAAAARSKTFALDYRLAPEHPFPWQLHDALAGYRYLLENGVQPRQLVVAGDSAGGNLALALLISLRDAALPLPALGLLLCPWTDLTNSGASMSANADYDMIDRSMAERWAEWYCAGEDRRHPLISPQNADLRGLCPLYVQAGSREILYDMICAFVERAKQQGADITFDVWPNMNHDFQAYGDLTPESAAALKRIGEVVDERIH